MTSVQLALLSELLKIYDQIVSWYFTSTEIVTLYLAVLIKLILISVCHCVCVLSIILFNWQKNDIDALWVESTDYWTFKNENHTEWCHDGQTWRDAAVPVVPQCTHSTAPSSLQHTRPDSHVKTDPLKHTTVNVTGMNQMWELIHSLSQITFQSPIVRNVFMYMGTVNWNLTKICQIVLLML